MFTHFTAFRSALLALRADLARIHRRSLCADNACSCRVGRPVRDALGFIHANLWQEPISAFGKRHFGGRGRSFCYFVARPIYFLFHGTRAGYRIYWFFHSLRPSVRRESRYSNYDQGADFMPYASYGGGVTDSLETRMPNEY